ncbi:hypothetical protein GGX14DRAFT_656690 [Mycena pura]|uniref:Uncharacterized protein n=1 Tax=Mycena pura TaxID=153505 RepID=A0AAD6V2Y5_9AGAR|nr:hypothetical protein GGX14DRAFT_656690 [Mycena pura]
MDGVYSIVAGLLLRVVVDAATFHNVKLSGTLIGLWEGIVLLHYVNKAPSSSDPYLAYGVRLFVDFIVTESIFKLMIVLLWSTMGMVLADVAPAVWVDYGLKRQWSRLRHELYWATRMFSRKRTSTVRFVVSPTIASTVSSEAGSTIATTTVPLSRTAPESPTSSVAPARPPMNARRRSLVPGTFPGGEWSETETEAGTVVAGVDETTATGSVFPSQSSHVTFVRVIPSEPSEDSYTFTTRSSSPTYSLEYSDDPSASNPVDIPSEVEDEILVHGHGRHQIMEEALQTTPKQLVVVLPPTPSESLQDWESSSRDDDDEDEDVPSSPWMPLIPDHEPLEEWETVNSEEVEAPPPAPPPKDTPELSPQDDGSDATSIGAPSTIAPTPAPADSAPIDPPSAQPSTTIPVFDHTPLATTPEEPSEPTQAAEEPPSEPTVDESAQTDNVAPPPASADAGAASDPPLTGKAVQTPPPSFEDLFSSDARAANPDSARDSGPPLERANTPPPAPSPVLSIKHALALRKEALELNARIATLSRQRKTSLSESTGAATSSAMLAKIEIESAKKALAELNEKAEGAFVGAYNPPTASLYEFNTTGLTPEEAVRQTEARLGKLLLGPVPPAGTTPEDLAHDSPNRGALKVTMQQSIKGRVVKKELLAALNNDGMNWFEDPSRPNVVFVLLPVTAGQSESAPEGEPDHETAPAAAATQRTAEDEDDAKEY